MKTVLVLFFLLTGCGSLSAAIPSLDACDEFHYDRVGDKAQIYAKDCRVR